MEDKLEEIINICRNTLSREKDWGLLTGNAGILSLIVSYDKWKNKETEVDLSYYLQTLLDNSIDNQMVTLAQGKSGINWFFQYLSIELDLLEWDICNEICSDFSYLHKLSLMELSKGNWDCLHGAMGIAYCSLYDFKSEYKSYFNDFFSELSKIASANKLTSMFPNYDFESNSFVADEVNFGLAHGITSILKFCIECYKRNICMEEAFELAYQIIDFLIRNTNQNKEHSLFPSIFKIGKSKETLGRLAWCYGDLGVAFILYQSGIALNLPPITTIALEALKHTTIRRSVEQTMIYDAGFCHGSAGVAHIYNKMWHYTNDRIFKDAADYWIQRTLDFAIHEDGVAGYKMYNPQDNTFSKSYGLLEGVAGIGLVLLSYLTGDFSWDYCIMLND